MAGLLRYPWYYKIERKIYKIPDTQAATSNFHTNGRQCLSVMAFYFFLTIKPRLQNPNTTKQIGSIDRTKLALGMKSMPFLVQMVSGNSFSCSLVIAFQGLEHINIISQPKKWQRPGKKKKKKRREPLRDAEKRNEGAQYYLFIA